MWRRRRGRRRRLICLTIIIVLVTISCTNLVGHPAIGSLEWRYPPNAKLPDRADAIIVLGSGTRVAGEDDASIDLDASGTFRCLKAAEVYHKAGPCLVVVSGGKSSSGTPGPPAARAMKDLLVRLDVDPADILVEETSRTTYENAVESWKLIQDRDFRHIVLVTDAVHLFRAERCFEALGRPVIPVGCNYQAVMFTWAPCTMLPSADAAVKVERALHEWVGILWYWLRGRLG
jgi:uncharacterized SAM-binding protein YcdF (DUF218 family)